MTRKSSVIILFFGLVCLPIGVSILGYQEITSIWNTIETNPEIMQYTEGYGYAFAGFFFPFAYFTVFPNINKHLNQKFMVYSFVGSFIIGVFITPWVIDYITEEKLIAKGYTYCDYKRRGSIRHLKRIWQLDPACKGEVEKS